METIDQIREQLYLSSIETISDFEDAKKHLVPNQSKPWTAYTEKQRMKQGWCILLVSSQMSDMLGSWFAVALRWKLLCDTFSTWSRIIKSCCLPLVGAAIEIVTLGEAWGRDGHVSLPSLVKLKLRIISARISCLPAFYWSLCFAGGNFTAYRFSWLHKVIVDLPYTWGNFRFL